MGPRKLQEEIEQRKEEQFFEKEHFKKVNPAKKSSARSLGGNTLPQQERASRLR